MSRDYPVPFEDWKIGMEFWMSGNHYRVTDVGSRTLIAICIDLPMEIMTMGRGESEATPEMTDDASWFNGPPYAVNEIVIDEYDLQVCTLEKPSDDE